MDPLPTGTHHPRLLRMYPNRGEMKGARRPMETFPDQDGDVVNQQKPNILLITTDQQHYQAIGTRTPGLKTPNLDRLAGQGAIFDRAYCPNPVCSPSRSSIITGQYPSTH